MEEWKEYRLGEVMQFNPKEKIAKGKVSRKIAMDQLVPFCRDVDSQIYEEYKGGAKFRNGDTIMARITPCLENGKTSYISSLEDDEVAFGSTEYIVLRNIEGVSDSRFVYYLSICPEIRGVAIKSMVGSSGRQRVQQDVLENYCISLPSLPTQQKIASILSSLDDKIEVNRRINEQLEELAQALFKSWFVDFEPFKDGDFVESELGMIPKGWKVRRLDEVSKLIAGGDKPNIVSSNKTDDTPYPIYSNGIDNYGLYGYSDNFRIKEESVTVSARGTIGYVCLREEPYTPIVRLISIIPNADSVSAKFIYHSLKIKPIQGTGTTQQQLTVPMFRNTLLVVPPQEVIGSFTLKADSLFALRRKNQQEILHLTTLRDTLLPKLMSGEIDVNEVEI